MAELIYKDEVYAIVGAAQEVYYQLGTGFLEAVYQEAMEIELRRRNIPVEPQKQLFISYKGVILRKEYCVDFVCYEKIIVELKAEVALCGRDVSQVLNYLKAAKMRVGLLFNFGSVGKLEWKRYVI
jgi:GxxExxY protein